MTTIKNVSGGVATIPSLGGTLDIADGATVDLLAVVNDEPLNFQVDLDRSRDLRVALLSGDWRVLSAEGEELSELDSLADLTPASSQQVSSLVRQPWMLVTPNPGDNDWFDVLEIDVPEGSAVAAALSVHVRAGIDATMDVAAVPYTFTARRRTGGSVSAPAGWAFVSGEGGIRFRLDERATTVAVQARRRGTGVVQVSWMGMIEAEQ